MNRSIRIAGVLTLIASASAIAQNPPPPGAPPPGGGPGPRREMAGPPAAEMLLSNVGELELTDQQVVRLAAIARRSAARRRSLSSAMDSARTRFTQPGDSVARRQFRQRMDAEMTRAEEQRRVDQRDAIAVLTPDQQAKAWNMVANRGGGRDVGRMAGMRGEFGRGRGGMRADRPQRQPGLRREEMRGRRPPGRRPNGQGLGNSE